MILIDKIRILNFQSINKSLNDLDQKLIVLLSCFALGAAKQSIHTEEIAYKAFLLKRDGFSWQIEKFQKYPD